jgi:hypothetical protein
VNAFLAKEQFKLKEDGIHCTVSDLEYVLQHDDGYINVEGSMEVIQTRRLCLWWAGHGDVISVSLLLYHLMISSHGYDPSAIMTMD